MEIRIADSPNSLERRVREKVRELFPSTKSSPDSGFQAEDEDEFRHSYTFSQENNLVSAKVSWVPDPWFDSRTCDVEMCINGKVFRRTQDVSGSVSSAMNPDDLIRFVHRALMERFSEYILKEMLRAIR